MNDSMPPHVLDRQLVDALYVDAMVLADEARSYFDDRAEEHRQSLGRIGWVDFSCESIKVTTRLMHVIAWLLTQRAIFNGEMRESVREEERYRLGPAALTPLDVSCQFNEEMRALIASSEELYARVARLERQFLARRSRLSAMPINPAHVLLTRLERAF
ncbi:regulator of CtrA degradation [Sphingobium sp. B2D3A]|uniref:DUF1465 family protein n=2 Tax=Sphingobium TaxID=165695 RepID=UPI0022241029|nr:MULTISPECIES: DUF1465 family protein [unclassified Sphingobium]MCW2337308.1 regulator of CtrA degradation [Sphingobium sp. B2D3A]MCW2383766.1 regulator of CtrA degradation [Sphingobium sp. B2D3D]MCW2395230.1 regulator of CtrA degradation [Sphingobium sp. B8D3B]MCW2398734.1 regulator of CtrA degradation [Sphingobium sp. B2D3C]MCW2418744.1 regulator of CtrA degradation [Sphingobium sp. B8D3C]